jgi:serine/threonine-protein kinase
MTTLGAVASPRAAFAQSRADSATAQALFEDARKLMTEGRYAEACPKFEESQRIDPGGGTLLNLGICYERQGKLASAWTTLLEAATSAKATHNVNRERTAREEASAIASRLGRITIRVTDNMAGLEVLRDGSIVKPAQWGAAIPADSGSHLIVASAPGHKTWQTTLSLKDGATETVIVPALEVAPVARTGLPAKPTDTASPTSGTASKKEARTETFGAQRVFAISAVGIGVAGLAVGSAFGLKSKAAHDDSQAAGVCSGASCQTQEGVDISDSAQRFGNVATIGFIVGAAGLVGGAALWFTTGNNAPQVGVGMGTLQMRATW